MDSNLPSLRLRVLERIRLEKIKAGYCPANRADAASRRGYRNAPADYLRSHALQRVRPARHGSDTSAMQAKGEECLQVFLASSQTAGGPRLPEINEITIKISAITNST
jgi:hypothetical protein